MEKRKVMSEEAMMETYALEREEVVMREKTRERAWVRIEIETMRYLLFHIFWRAPIGLDYSFIIIF